MNQGTLRVELGEIRMAVTPGSDVTKPQATKTYNVEADRELRFEVDKEKVLTVTVSVGA